MEGASGSLRAWLSHGFAGYASHAKYRSALSIFEIESAEVSDRDPSPLRSNERAVRVKLKAYADTQRLIPQQDPLR